MSKLIWQYHQGEMMGNIYQSSTGSYYYRIYFRINGKNKTIAQSYCNYANREMCEERMMLDMEIIDTRRLEKLK